MDKNLTDKSDELLEKANNLLKSFSFEKLAKKYFSGVKVVGSTATNTMLDPDIDINCELKQLDTKIILEFVDELFRIKECRKVSLYNQLLSGKPHFIVNIEKFEFENEKWIITFFISTSLGDAPEFSNWVKENIDKEKRQVILKLKEHREKNNQKRSIPSHLIYKAVISENISTIPDFKKYLAKNGIDPDKEDAY